MLELKKLCLTANDENGKTEILKNNSHVSAEIRDFLFLHLVKVIAFNDDCARRWNLLTHNQLKKCALSRSRCSDDEHELALSLIHI